MIFLGAGLAWQSGVGIRGENLGAGVALARVGAGMEQSLDSLLGAWRRHGELGDTAAWAGRVAAVVREFVFHAGAAAPAAFSVAAVEEYLTSRLAAGAARKTVANRRRALSAFCQWLIARGALTGPNPCRAVKLRPPEETVPRWLAEAEVAQVLGLAREFHVWPEVALALATGLRVAEIARLRWDEVAVERRWLRVSKSKTRRIRVVPLNEMAVAALEDQRAMSGALVFVFPARRAWRGGWRYVDRARSATSWAEALRPVAMCVPKFHAGQAPAATGRGWHLLRHTFASRLAQAGVSIYKIAQWLGHRNIRTTEIYAHLAPAYDVAIEAAGWPAGMGAGKDDTMKPWQGAMAAAVCLAAGCGGGPAQPAGGADSAAVAGLEAAVFVVADHGRGARATTIPLAIRGVAATAEMLGGTCDPGAWTLAPSQGGLAAVRIVRVVRAGDARMWVIRFDRDAGGTWWPFSDAARLLSGALAAEVAAEAAP